MGFGLFGKLPQKRDFISFGIPPNVLNPLETWLQSAVSASRLRLGGRWEQFYLVAPLWRFWIGPEVLGAGCAGVLMSSVDRVGRFFPLLALYTAAPGETVAPPPFVPQGEWFETLEARLLSVLDEASNVDPDRLLGGLDPPATEEIGGNGLREFKGGALWTPGAHASAAALLPGIVEDDYRMAARSRTYWWTTGNEATGPMLYVTQGLPDPYFYTVMLSLVPD
jgi:type VI secretion system protein ImpM